MRVVLSRYDGDGGKLPNFSVCQYISFIRQLINCENCCPSRGSSGVSSAQALLHGCVKFDIVHFFVESFSLVCFDILEPSDLKFVLFLLFDEPGIVA